MTIRLRAIAMAVGCAVALLQTNRGIAEDSIRSTNPPSVKPSSRKQIEKALETRMSISFVKVPLSEVADFFAEKLKVNVRLDKQALKYVGSDFEPLTWHLRDITARSILGLILSQIDLTYIIEDGVLLITTPEKAASKLGTVVYPVEDLVQSTNEFGEPIHDFEGLMDLITSATMPTTWDEVGGIGIIQAFNGCLIVTQTHEAHRILASLLAKIRQLKNAPADAKLPVFIHIDQNELANDLIRKKLNQQVSVSFDEASLADVAQKLGEQLQINVQVDVKPIKNDSVPADSRVTLQLNNVPATTALKLMLDGLESCRDDTVMILYPVLDLIGHAVDREQVLAELGGTITRHVDITNWDTVGGAGLVVAVPIAGALIVSATEGTQEGVQELLSNLRQSKPKAEDAPRYETRIYHLSVKPLVSAPAEQKDSPAKTAPALPAQPSPDDIAKLLRELVEPQSWSTKGVAIHALGDKLIIRHSPSAHHRIGRLLTALGLTPWGGGCTSVIPVVGGLPMEDRDM